MRVGVVPQITFGPEMHQHWPPGDMISVAFSDVLEVTFSGGETRRLEPLWLRDQCPCSACRIEQTEEHRFFLGFEASLPELAHADVVDGTLALRWHDGHVSHYTKQWITKLLQSVERGRSYATTWDGDTSLSTWDHDTVVADPATRLKMFLDFKEFGVVRVDGVPGESGEVERFISTMGAPVRETPFGRIHDVFVDPDGYNVAHTAEALPLHNDFASYSWPPTGQLLHMLRNEASGGDSLLVDAWHVLHQVEEAHPEHIDVLATTPVAFREHSDNCETWARQPMVRRDADGRVTALRFSNQLMQPLDPTHPDTGLFYRAYHAVAKAVSDQANQLRFRLEAGQLLMVHGHRVLHARTSFEASSGARHLQDTYFEADDIDGQIMLLSNAFAH